MGSADYFAPGQNNLRCQECFKKIKSGEAYFRWDGFWVHYLCWEIRNPQDYQRGIPDFQTPKIITGDPPPIFINGTTTTTSNGYPLLFNGRMLNANMLG
jgi:hypothetical protein